MRRLSFLWLFILFVSPAFGQYQRYLVQLKDKAGSPFNIGNPGQFLSERALGRRQRAAIVITQTDLPVNPFYLQALQNIAGVQVLNSSKWFNQVAIRVTNPTALDQINSLSFVRSVKSFAPRPANPRPRIKKIFDVVQTPPAANMQRPLGTNDFFNYGDAYVQIQLHQGQFLHNWGFRGQGMQIAVMDAGFSRYTSLPTFDSIRQNNQVLHTWDFVANKTRVDDEHPHGMQCLSTMAANMPGRFVGSSPAASYYLYRTEDAGSEYPIEEHFFAVAAEQADSAGADVFSVSLGYNQFDDPEFDYSYADMNGDVSLIARAADMAAAKGIAVVVAAGNAGGNAWRYIVTPADADSVLCVGAVDANGQVAGFSSYGPAADGQIKPDVVAIGAGAAVASTSNGQPFFGNGTSYACPIMAGLATCLWQAFPAVSNMYLFTVLRQASSNYVTPNNRIGYGIPDVKKAFVRLQKETLNRTNAATANCQVQWNGQVNAAAGMYIVVQRNLPANSGFVPVDTLSATGQFAHQSFSFKEDLLAVNPMPNLQYRLVMHVGADTSYLLDSFFVRWADVCPQTELPSLTVMPNPVLQNARIKIVATTAGAQQLVLHNSLGQQVYQATIQIAAGTQFVELPMQKMPGGIYQLSSYQGNQSLYRKRILKK